MLVGGESSAEDRLGGAEARLAAVRLVTPTPQVLDGLLAEAVSRPIFALTTGPGAVADVTVRLDGLARSSRGGAALLSINGGPAQWLQQGASRDGVTLRDVQSSKVVLATALGGKEVALADQAAPAPDAAARPPPGYRMPPAPASAP